jgi:adenosine deaminase
MRNAPDSEAVARLAVAHRRNGVVGFDLSGPEAGYPADDHLPACRYATESGLGLTLHAGEGDDPASIWRALRSGAQRLGHGVRIIEDTVVEDGDVVELGTLAAVVRDRRVPLEVCIQSNVDIGLYPDVAAHPVGALRRAGFVVTLNTDDRLMSRTTMADEFRLAVEHHGFGLAELGEATEAALVAGFADWPTRRRLIEDVVRPAYAGYR